MRYPFAMPCLCWLILWASRVQAQTSDNLSPEHLSGSFPAWPPFWWAIISIILLLLGVSIWLYFKLKRQLKNGGYPKLLRKKGDIYFFIDNKELSQELLDLMKDEIKENRQNGHNSSLKVILPNSNNSKKKEEAPELSEEEEKQLKKIYNIIENRINNTDFSIDGLCKELGMSRSQLHRKLKALTGTTASQLIKSIKIKKAKELLKNPALTITAIAYDSGFTDPAYFHRVFKQEVGLTPKQFREMEEI